MYELATCPAFYPPPMGFSSTTGNEGTALGGAAASTIASTLVATGAVAGPVGAAIGAGISLVATLIASFTQGCGQTCIETSNWANQAEALLLQNIQAYFAQPAPRSLSSQQAALANFQTTWNWLVQQCSGANLGTAGQNCVSDRQQGACTWKQTTTSPLLAYTQYGEPGPGACWNWWSGYYAPIANDTGGGRRFLFGAGERRVRLERGGGDGQLVISSASGSSDRGRTGAPGIGALTWPTI